MLALIKLMCGCALLVVLVVGARLLTHRVPVAQVLIAAGMVIAAVITTALTLRAWLRRGIDG